MLHKGWQVLVDLLLPLRCLLCQHVESLDRTPFCLRCTAELFEERHPACPRCAAVIGPFGSPDGMCGNCRPDPPAFDASVRLAGYVGAMQQAVLLGKHSWHESLLELLGRELARRRCAVLPGPAVDAVVPIPLHWSRHWLTGYNHSQAIAYGLSRELRVPLRSDWLRRVRWTQPQKNLRATQRWHNVHRAFRARKVVTGRHVLLVDDVMTTCATARAAAVALKQAGANRVSVAVLARAASAPGR